MLEETGVPTKEQIDACYPPEWARKKGPVAVFECFQRIPCDPCCWSCAQGAVREFADINDLPVIDYERCTGCGICVAKCPGLAVFVIDENYDDEYGLVKLPHEFLPLPEAGDRVEALDRTGAAVGAARVIRVTGRQTGETAVVWIVVGKPLLGDVRAIRVGGERS
jgi:Fe-S-cluster-containing hydrogenase component 2